MDWCNFFIIALIKIYVMNFQQFLLHSKWECYLFPGQRGGINNHLQRSWVQDKRDWVLVTAKVEVVYFVSHHELVSDKYSLSLPFRILTMFLCFEVTHLPIGITFYCYCLFNQKTTKQFLPVKFHLSGEGQFHLVCGTTVLGREAFQTHPLLQP